MPQKEYVPGVRAAIMSKTSQYAGIILLSRRNRITCPDQGHFPVDAPIQNGFERRKPEE